MGKKIAVLGSGIGSLSAAYYLAKSNQGHKIVVYQMGWRCGGKGASGRPLDPKKGGRIEEHGLHMWSGLYDNAFRVMRECFELLKYEPGLPLQTWRDAFTPHSSIVMYEKWKNQYLPWPVVAPTNSKLPGDPKSSLFLGLYDYLIMILQFVSWFRGKNDDSGNKPLQPPLFYTAIASLLYVVLWPIWHLLLLFVKVLNFLGVLNFLLLGMGVIVRLFMGLVWWVIKPKLDQTTLRRLWMSLNFGYAHFNGLVKSNALKNGLDPLDSFNYRDWIGKYMWPDYIDSESITLNSPFTRFLYDAQFSYEDGNLNLPNLGAGASVRTLLRMALTFKGSILWRMEGSMGEVVFVPLYQALQKLGVEFKFFSQITDLECDPSFKSVQKIKGLTQAKPKSTAYHPLFWVKGIQAWPSEPFWEQLENGDELRKSAQFENPKNTIGTPFELVKGVDFDEIVYGFPIECIKTVGASIVAAKPQWQACLRYLKTVPTQAFQAWMNQPQGYLDTAGQGQALAVTYGATPLNTMANMSFLISRENWERGTDPSQYPSSLFYFCGPLAAPKDVPFNDVTLVTQNVKALLKDKMGVWMPGSTIPAHSPGSPFDTKLLVDPSGADPSSNDRISAQYLRQNTTPSELFTLTNVGSTPYRLAAKDSGLDNLFLTGDWTANTFNLANIEATVMSGMLCSHAMCAYPPLDEITGLGFGCNLVLPGSPQS